MFITPTETGAMGNFLSCLPRPTLQKPVALACCLSSFILTRMTVPCHPESLFEKSVGFIKVFSFFTKSSSSILEKLIAYTMSLHRRAAWINQDVRVQPRLLSPGVGTAPP